MREGQAKPKKCLLRLLRFRALKAFLFREWFEDRFGNFQVKHITFNLPSMSESSLWYS